MKLEKGFTLLEFVIIVALLGLVLSASYIFVPQQLKKSRDARRKSDLENIKGVYEDYYQDKGIYPDSLPSCGESFRIGNEVLLSSVPCDPLTGEDYFYMFCNGEKTNWYKIYTNLEIETDPEIGYINCSSGCGPDCEYNYGVSSANVKLDTCGVTYACGPGGGSLGACEIFQNPDMSNCPKVFLDDPTCNNECSKKM
jgi:type II secretory pathway pseudopilin PulG